MCPGLGPQHQVLAGPRSRAPQHVFVHEIGRARAVAAGLAAGCALSWLATALRVVSFPAGLAEVYMVDSIPFRPLPVHLVAVLVVCLVLVLLASLGPAWKTSTEDPVASLRRLLPQLLFSTRN